MGKRYLVKDPNLQNLLDNVMNHRYIFGSSQNIASLEGIEQYSNITSLALDHNQISDISPLNNLTKLRYLALDDNKIIDISPLKNLINLEELHIRESI